MKKVIVLLLVLLVLSLAIEARPVHISKAILSKKKSITGAIAVQSAVTNSQAAINAKYYDKTVATHFLYPGTCKSDIGTIKFTIRGRTCSQVRTEPPNQWSCVGQGAKCIGTACPDKLCSVQRNQIGVFV